MLSVCSNFLQKTCSFECYPLLQTAYRLLSKAPKEVEHLRKELKKLHDCLMEAAKKMAESEGWNRESMKNKATNLITIYFRIEDVIEEWILCDQHEKYSLLHDYKYIFSNYFSLEKKLTFVMLLTEIYVGLTSNNSIF